MAGTAAQQISLPAHSAQPATPLPSWATDGSLSDSTTLSPEPTDRGSTDSAPSLPESTKLLLQQAREGRSVRFAGLQTSRNRSPDRLDTRTSGRSIRAWPGAPRDAVLAPFLPAAATVSTAAERAIASAPAKAASQGELSHAPPPRLPVSIPEHSCADVPGMPRVKSAASIAGLPPIRKTYPSMELRLDVQARPNSAPPASSLVPPARGSLEGSQESPDSTMSGSSGSQSTSYSWLRPDRPASMLSPFGAAALPNDALSQVDPWSEEAFNSAPSSPRPSTPDLAKQRGSSAALEALRAPSAAQAIYAGPHCVWDRKGRGSSAALDALRTSEAPEMVSDDSVSSILGRRWSAMRERAAKSLTRQRSGPAPIVDRVPSMPSITQPSMSLRSLWRCSAGPVPSSELDKEE